MSSRMKEQADFDLERVMDLFDTALTSNDERVQSALRQLLTIVALTQTQEDGNMAISERYGPLRQMQEDIRNLGNTIHRMESELNSIRNSLNRPYNPYPGQHPYSGTGTGPWGPDPNAPYTLGSGYGPIYNNAGGVAGQTASVSAPTNLNNFTNTFKITK